MPNEVKQENSNPSQQEPTMTREELPARDEVYVGDDLTEAERLYFESGGQDVSALLKDPSYKKDVESLNAEREQIEYQRSQAKEDPDAQTYEEIPAKKSPEQPLKSKQDLEKQPEQPSLTTDEQSLGEGDEFEFDELQVGQDGRLRDSKGKFVPLAALRQERERFKQQRDSNNDLKRENSELKEKYDRLSERITTLQEVWKQPQQQKEQNQEEKPKTIAEGLKELINAEGVPTPEEDIFGHANWQKGIIEKQNQAIAALEEMISNNRKEIIEKEINPVRNQVTENDIVNYYRQDAVNFSNQEPSFGEAYKYLMDQRHATLALAGWDADKRSKQIRQEERELVDIALKQNKRPAEFIYNYAIASGFRPQSAAVDPNPKSEYQPPQDQITQQQPTPTVTQQPLANAQGQETHQPSAQDNAQRLMSQANAQNASETLSGTGGSASEPLTAEAIANMSEKDFIALSEKLGRNGMRQYLGGI